MAKLASYSCSRYSLDGLSSSHGILVAILDEICDPTMAESNEKMMFNYSPASIAESFIIPYTRYSNRLT